MAKEFGIWNVEGEPDSLDRLISWEQLYRWQVYYSLEPWGEVLHDAQLAQITSILAEVNRDAKKRPQHYGISDFTLIKPLGKGKSSAKPLTDPKQWRALTQMLKASTGSKRNKQKRPTPA